MIKTDAEIQDKITDCKQNKMQYVEWLCQNKTEKQLEKLLKRFDKLSEFAVYNNIVGHIELIDLWKDQVNTALRILPNSEHLYNVLKKMNRNKKLSFHEKLVRDCNYEWFYNRIYGLVEEEIKIGEGK